MRKAPWTQIQLWNMASTLSRVAPAGVGVGEGIYSTFKGDQEAAHALVSSNLLEVRHCSEQSKYAFPFVRVVSLFVSF